jgi:cell division protein FtsL
MTPKTLLTLYATILALAICGVAGATTHSARQLQTQRSISLTAAREPAGARWQNRQTRPLTRHQTHHVGS